MRDTCQTTENVNVEQCALVRLLDCLTANKTIANFPHFHIALGNAFRIIVTHEHVFN